jgi:hypothetical protein
LVHEDDEYRVSSLIGQLSLIGVDTVLGWRCKAAGSDRLLLLAAEIVNGEISGIGELDR